MQAKAPTVRTIFPARWLVRAAVALALLLAFAFAQTASAQCLNPNPLCLSKNYFVTGDYVVGGVGLRGLGNTTTKLATGTINIPDLVQAQATGVPSPSVPPGADIVAAFLYWETVESSSQLPPHPGQNGFFNGYGITGTILGNPNAPTSWSAGGCSGSSQGAKTIVGYRADVRPFLPVDANGKVQGNGAFQVQLADSGSGGGGTPLTLGASLVIIYRALSPAVPLNAIVLYDGAFAPSNQTTPNSEMTQTIQGFYEPALTSPAAKLTHIVGDGQSNKSEQVFFQNNPLPFLYPTISSNAAFPGVYNGSWDNATWDVSPFVKGGSLMNGLPSGFDTSETTSVVPGSSGGGCVDWGAIIFSTTVQDTDGDGLIDVWEVNKGYTDAISGQFVALPGANPNVRDIFVEVDYLQNLDGLAGPYLHSHLPKQSALDKVGNAFANHNVHVHFDVGNVYQSPLPGGPSANCGTQMSPVACDPYIISNPAGTGGNAISEGLFVCTDGATLCVFPGTPVIAWKEGFLFVKNNATLPNSNPPAPLGNFQAGRKDSYHYALFGHALGSSRTHWSAAGKAPSLTGSGIATLVSIVVNNNVGSVTLTTPPLLLKPGDIACSDANCDRVTVQGALQPQNSALNTTYKFLSPPSSTFDGTTNMFTTTFTIQTAGVANGTYDFFSEPRLGLMYGGPTSASGHSDIGGSDSAVMFGSWPADDTPGCQADPSVPLAPGQMYCVNQVGTIQGEAGTLLHELGHTFTLTHGGTFYPNGAVMGQQVNNPPGVPSFGLNCNPGFLSSMNYLFQIRGFPDLLPDGSHPIDYSGQTLPSLSELTLNEALGIGSDLFPPGNPAAHFTRWYAPPNALDTLLQNTTGGRFATVHCDGTPIGPNEPPAVRVDGSTFSAPIDWNNDLIVPDMPPFAWQDVNFNGSTFSSPDPPPSPAFNDMQGFNDWVNLDLRQIGAQWKAFGFSSGGTGADAGGGTGADAGGGTAADAGGGTGADAGGGTGADAGGGIKIEQDAETACSTADPPTGLTAVQSGHNVVLSWAAPEQCQVRQYDIWRAVVIVNQAPQFIHIGKVNGAPPATTFTDDTVKNKTKFAYFVTDTSLVPHTNKKVQSGPSNTVTIFVLF